MPSGPISFTYLWTLSSHLHQQLSSNIFLRFPHHAFHMPHPSHPPLTHHSILVESTHHKAPHYAIFSTPVTLSHSGLNISLSTLLPSTLSLCSTLKCTDQFSHPYKIAPYILIFSVIFLCDVPNSSFIFIMQNTHIKFCSLLSRGRNILALY